MHVKIKLGKISTISTGFNFRGPIHNGQTGNVLVVQATNLLNDGSVADDGELKRVKMINQPDSVMVSSGDILLVSRGTPAGGFKAAYVKKVQYPLIASSSLHIIRIKSDDILPEFLCAYLNSPKGQQQLQRIASGSAIRTLPGKSLLEIEIPVPSFPVQQTTINLVRNINSQQKILFRRSTILKSLISSIVSGKIK